MEGEEISVSDFENFDDLQRAVQMAEAPVEAAADEQDPIGPWSMSDDDMFDQDECADGYLMNLVSGMFHKNGTEQQQSTKCGKPFTNSYELRSEFSPHDIRCCRCFKLPIIRILGRSITV